MPEGPSIVILREQVAGFAGKKVLRVAGNSRVIDPQRMQGQVVRRFCSWGKHFLVVFDGFFLRLHFMLFGSYRVDERREGSDPRLQLGFARGREINFHACSLKYVEGDPDDHYDWSADVMSDAWDNRATLKKLRARPRLLACDALLDQTLFSGSGNIIKNEVLFRTRIHPLSLIGDLPAAKLRELTREVRTYSFEFLQWKREGTLKAHWLAHTKTICPRCKIPFVRAKALGRSKRRSFYCERCQKRYGDSENVTPEVPVEEA